MIATGRMYVSVRPYAQKLGLDVPLVTYNGALVKGSLSGKVYYEHKMKLSTANEVLAYCREKGYYLQLYVGDSILIKQENDCSRMYTKSAVFRLLLSVRRFIIRMKHRIRFLL